VTSTRSVHYRTSPDLIRRDVSIESDPGIEIGIRSVRSDNTGNPGFPVLMIHGARASSIPSFDLDVDGGSFAAELARAGHTVYLIDARNYGHSTRVSEMDLPPESSEPLSRSQDVVRDIDAAVALACRECAVDRVALFGWATGGQWMAHYAATHPGRVRDLILYNSLMPVQADWPIGDAIEDPNIPGAIKPGAVPGYALATKDALLARWDGSIPIEDPDDWRDPLIAEEYARAAIDADPRSRNCANPRLRVPLGALANSFLLSRGHRLFDPTKIAARMLVVRSELDFWSRSEDISQAPELCTSAAAIDTITLPEATHFAHLDRPERGRNQLKDAIIERLTD
jgi:pimeloyl-ACP methyl ester carboxylesterase